MARKIKGKWSAPHGDTYKSWTLYHPETNEELGTLYEKVIPPDNEIRYEFHKTSPTNNYYGKTLEKIIYDEYNLKIKDERDAMMYIEKEIGL